MGATTSKDNDGRNPQNPPRSPVTSYRGLMADEQLSLVDNYNRKIQQTTSRLPGQQNAGQANPIQNNSGSISRPTINPSKPQQPLTRQPVQAEATAARAAAPQRQQLLANAATGPGRNPQNPPRSPVTSYRGLMADEQLSLVDNYNRTIQQTTSKLTGQQNAEQANPIQNNSGSISRPIIYPSKPQQPLTRQPVQAEATAARAAAPQRQQPLANAATGPGRNPQNPPRSPVTSYRGLMADEQLSLVDNYNRTIQQTTSRLTGQQNAVQANPIQNNSGSISRPIIYPSKPQQPLTRQPVQAEATAARAAAPQRQQPLANAATGPGEENWTRNSYQRRNLMRNDEEGAAQTNKRSARHRNRKPSENNRDLPQNDNRDPPRNNQNPPRNNQNPPRNNQNPPRNNQNHPRNNQNQPFHQNRQTPRSDQNSQNSSGNGANQARRGNHSNRGEVRQMGFRLLEEISKLDSFDALVRMQTSEVALRDLLHSQLQPDFFVLLLNILANICHSCFDESKGHILIAVCNSNFIANLQMYIMQLPYTSPQDKNRNKLFWSDPDSFWDNLLKFCETLVLLSPSTALAKCRALVESAIGLSLTGLKDQHYFTVKQNVHGRLDELKEQFASCEIKAKEEKKKERMNPQLLIIHEDESQPPPNNFRELSVLPTSDDLLGQMPYVRPNIVNGGYVDLDHYLDVQFRLLREDCYGPLRDGIRQYMTDPKKKRYDNIRVHKEVKILEPYHSREKIGVLVQFEKVEDTRTKKGKKHQNRLNWAHSKRFMFGSLLLFTRDNCASFLLATVIDRDVKTLEKGLLPVSLYGADRRSSESLFKGSFMMIESEVYFEPYFHVLKALQDPTFVQHLAMRNYIVHVQPATNPPLYLKDTSVYTVDGNDDGMSRKIKITVLNEDSWPEPEELGLDRTQYDAYKFALTHEFSVIQGPPGTGKTFLGVLVARTLLENLKISGCAMLVICYTNHALDQFLEAILKVTDSIVRIGGQSKSEVLQNYNLKQLRSVQSKTNRSSNVHKLFYERKKVLEQITNANLNLQNSLSILNNGLVGIDLLRMLVKEAEVLAKTYESQNEDSVLRWLFEGAERLYGGENIQPEIDEEDDEFGDAYVDHDEDPNELILDDFDEVIELDVKNIFNVDDIKKDIRNWTMLLHRSDSAKQSYGLQRLINLWQARLNCYEENKKLASRNHPISIQDRAHPGHFDIPERWAIYYKWVQTVKKQKFDELAALQENHNSATDEYEETRVMVDRKLLEKTRVVGMTTTGAARLQKLIRSLQPPIIIVEEAAEVLESHIVVSLTRHCQHLILIGDHQQLRPSASHFKLAKHYNMEISLFERMITNGIHSRRLGVQHRMRPSIASLIVPAIYPELGNHASVERYPPVRGLTANLFFLTHDKQEDVVTESSSRQNQFEADMILSLKNYIMQQGYQPEDVTILAAYSGQMFCLRKRCDQYNHLKNCKITVVDNYQGEESKIILLSLVRNNKEGNIGFLGTPNRVCVALSRAKEGFYIMGNMDMLKQATDLWKSISESLEKQAALGASIMLRCEIHPDQITQVKALEDFQKVPEGGCMLKCGINLPCGHLCPLLCHAYDRGHVKVVCHRKCERVLCELGHICPLPCAVQCGPCIVPVRKELPCGHQQSIACHLDPADPCVKCHTMVEATLPACQHKVTKACYVNVNDVHCSVPCVYRLPCGHACVNRCHKTKDPEHLHYTCEKPCTRLKNGCTAEFADTDFGNHACKQKCYQACGDCHVEVKKRRSECTHRQLVKCCVDVNSEPCKQNCNRALPCGHFCNNKCHEPCGNCNKKVKKAAPCGHEVEVFCKDEPKPEDCRSNCKRTLPCGHRCVLQCNQPCSKAQCKELVSEALKSPCGHLVHLPCYAFTKGLESEEQLLQYCTTACNQTLVCEHVCSGSCGGCRQGRLHAPCTQPCRKPLLCGHECEEPCNETCPPCKKPCEVCCGHTQCGRPCWQPCVPCKEPCSRGCAHGKCDRTCSDPCSRAACDEPCPLPLACGHRCRGLCGEPCPNVCDLCSPDDFPKDFLGDDFEEGDKFIQLQDCKSHYMELENMENLMKGDQETIMIRTCPFCRKPIINNSRYKDLINATFREQIDPIKRKVYGDEKDNTIRRDQLCAMSERILDGFEETATDKSVWETVLKKIRKLLANKSLKISLPELNMHSISLDILQMLAESYGQFIEGNLTAFRSELTDQIAIICHVLAANTRKISLQQQKDIELEIKRTHAIVQLSKIMSNKAYVMGKAEQNVKTATERARGVVFTWKTFNENSARVALELLERSVKLSGVITKAERDLIVKAVGMKQGHWFKCPNGHFYCIDACGGAMQTSKCADCGVAIGGGSHTLLADNRHAPEIDGSSHAAWSETANNMANWRF